MTQKIDINKLKQSISIVDLISQSFQVIGSGHTLTTKEHDSLKLFTHNNSFYWYSRGIGGSVIDWYMMTNGCDFKTAIQELDSGSFSINFAPAPAPSAPPAPKKLNGGQWQKKADQRAQAAQKHLLADHPAGVVYLKSRGLCLDICKKWGLGFDPMVFYSKDESGSWLHAPAIMFPYHDMNGQIVGIRYRWLEDIGEDKSFALGGSQFSIAEFGLYRLWHDKRGSATLFVCEGEMNALSIRQCGYDAVSVGSESATITDELIELSTDYYNVICWMDKSNYAAKNARLLDAKPIKSPHGLDANDLLQKGMLSEFLKRVI